jgi:hypothetical protein
LRPQDVGWELPVWLSNTIYLVVGFGCFLALETVIGVWRFWSRFLWDTPRFGSPTILSTGAACRTAARSQAT